MPCGLLNSSTNRLVLRMSRRKSSSIRTVLAQQANAVGADTFDVGVLRNQNEDFHDGKRRTLEDVGVRDLDIAITQQETTVKRRGLANFAGVEDLLFEVLDDQIAQFGDRHHDAVVLLHKTLNGALAVAVFVTK